ncbi:MAG: hypothetical protein LUH50_11895 [Bacteroides intestinalis]|nr:hypothetical protein [Bacteroides intestinalis]
MNKKTSLFLLFIILSASIMARSTAVTEVSKSPFAGYLFAYFEGQGKQQEHLRFGISTDAVNWKALNRNYPVVSSDTISKSGGIRDPHIMRGEDGKSFYIVATDMNVAKNGWGPNPGIVLMKSDDLIHWTHSYIELAKDFPKNFGNAHWVWAPQQAFQ